MDPSDVDPRPPPTPPRQRTSEATKNLQPSALPLDWAGGLDAEPAVVLFRRAENKAIEAIDWYIREKDFCSVGSRLVRVLAVLLVAAGTITPLVHVAHPSTIGIAWGYVFLAGAAAVIAADRVLGYSANYTRHVATALRLQQTLDASQTAVAHFLVARRRPADRLDPETQSAIAALSGGLSASVLTVMERETANWASTLTEELAHLAQVASRGESKRDGQD